MDEAKGDFLLDWHRCLPQYADLNVCYVNTYSPTNVLFRIWAFKFVCPLPQKVCGRSLDTQHSSLSLVCEIKCCMWNKKSAVGFGESFSFLPIILFFWRVLNQSCDHLWHLKNYVLYSAMKPLFTAKALCLIFNLCICLHRCVCLTKHMDCCASIHWMKA